MDDDRRQKSERTETDRGQKRQRTDDADLGQLVGGKREQIPDQAEDARSPAAADRCAAGSAKCGSAPPEHHDQQHRVERDAGAEADQIEELAHDLLRLYDVRRGA